MCEWRKINVNEDFVLPGIGVVKVLANKLNMELIEQKNWATEDFVLVFTPDKALGAENDAVTFVQAVQDDFYIKKGGTKHYTWTEGKDTGLEGRNCPAGREDLVLSIDQVITGKNRDFRYPEVRTAESGALSSEDSKLDKLLSSPELLAEFKVVFLPEHLDEMEELRQSPGNYRGVIVQEGLEKNIKHFLSPEAYAFLQGSDYPYAFKPTDRAQQREYFRHRFYDASDLLVGPCYGTQRRGGSWKPARFSDSPTLYCSADAEEIGGSKTFELVVLYEGAEKKALCTISWGMDWTDKNGTPVLRDVQIRRGCTEEFKAAVARWDQQGENLIIPIGEIKDF